MLHSELVLIFILNRKYFKCLESDSYVTFKRLGFDSRDLDLTTMPDLHLGLETLADPRPYLGLTRKMIANPHLGLAPNMVVRPKQTTNK